VVVVVVVVAVVVVVVVAVVVPSVRKQVTLHQPLWSIVRVVAHL